MNRITRHLLWVVAILLTMSGCSRGLEITWKNEQVKTAVAETAISSIVQTLAATGIAPGPTSEPITPGTINGSSPTWESTPTTGLTSTPGPSNPPTPTETVETIESSARDSIRNRMNSYGYINEDQLSDRYWETLTDRIALYGSARNILTLEYHCDDYTMYDGQYSMSPASFHDQVAYLMAQDYHFVTMHEAEGFVYGWLELPARSVILTTDISDLHVASLQSITRTFSDLESIYGYTPHMLAFIWTNAMNAGKCSNNTCWNILNEANESGYFTFGSHSATHRDFKQISEAEGAIDLQTSNLAILSNMGINSFALAWPFETCSPYPNSLGSLGITLAWGGSTKPLPKNFTSLLDPRPLCLPRLLPPNIQGISMRPSGMTLPEMLDSALIAP